MNPIRTPRLRPWRGADDKPCYLITDGTGRLAHLADHVETVQLGLARQVMERARGALGGPQPSPEDLRALAANLVDALRDALLIAECRRPAGDGAEHAPS